jgi:hypothetical protein
MQKVAGLSVQRRLSLPGVSRLDRVKCLGSRPMFQSLAAELLKGNSSAASLLDRKPSATQGPSSATQPLLDPANHSTSRLLDSTGLTALRLAKNDSQPQSTSNTRHVFADQVGRLLSCPYAALLSPSALMRLVTKATGSPDWTLAVLGPAAAAAFLRLSTDEMVRRMHKCSNELLKPDPQPSQPPQLSPSLMREAWLDLQVRDIAAVNQLLARSKEFVAREASEDKECGTALLMAVLRFYAATLQPSAAMELLQRKQATSSDLLLLAMASCADPDLLANDGAGGGVFRCLAYLQPYKRPPSLQELACICNSVASVTELAEAHRIFMEVLTKTEQGYSAQSEEQLVVAVSAFHGAVARYGHEEPTGVGDLLRHLCIALLTRTSGAVLRSQAAGSSLVQALAAVGDLIGCHRTANAPSLVLDAHGRYALHAVAPDASAALTSLDSAWISGRHRPCSSSVVACLDRLLHEAEDMQEVISRMFTLLSLCEANRLLLDPHIVGRVMQAVCRMGLDHPEACDLPAAATAVGELFARLKRDCLSVGAAAQLDCSTLSCLEELWIMLSKASLEGKRAKLEPISKVLREGSENRVRSFAAFRSEGPVDAHVLPERWISALRSAATGTTLLSGMPPATGAVSLPADLVADLLRFVETSSVPTIVSPSVLADLLRIALLSSSAHLQRNMQKALLATPKLVIVDSLGSATARLRLAADSATVIQSLDALLLSVASDASRSYWEGACAQQRVPLWRQQSLSGRFGSWYPATAFDMAAVRRRVPAAKSPPTTDQTMFFVSDQ